MKLKPCPFCGEEDLEIKQTTNDSNYFILCLYCGMRGPWAFLEINAIELWNLRK